MSTEHWPQIDMVLSEELTGKVRFGVLGAVLRTIHTWLQGLSRPEDINDVDEDGTTVLSLCITSASLRGRRQITDYLTAVRWLLKRGADVTIADQRGWTPLHQACCGPIEFGRHVIPQLLAAGADIDAKSTAFDSMYVSGMTPLSISIDQFRRSAIRSSPTVAEQIAGTGSYVINQSAMDEKVARNALAFVTTLIRYGASIDNCWGGHHAETWMCALEDRRVPHGTVLDYLEDPFIATPEAGVLNENNYWLACKALIKDVRVAPRKTVLTLRSLAIKGRAKTADPILNFVVHGLPDGVACNVLSFWPVERKRIVPSWNYADIGAGDTPAMAALTTQLEISKNQAHLRGVRDADSKTLKYLCHAIALLNTSESSTTPEPRTQPISNDQLRSLAEASRQRRIAGREVPRRIVRGQGRREGPA